MYSKPWLAAVTKNERHRHGLGAPTLWMGLIWVGCLLGNPQGQYLWVFLLGLHSPEKSLPPWRWRSGCQNSGVWVEEKGQGMEGSSQQSIRIAICPSVFKVRFTGPDWTPVPSPGVLYTLHSLRRKLLVFFCVGRRIFTQWREVGQGI